MNDTKPITAIRNVSVVFNPNHSVRESYCSYTYNGTEYFLAYNGNTGKYFVHSERTGTKMYSSSYDYGSNPAGYLVLNLLRAETKKLQPGK